MEYLPAALERAADSIKGVDTQGLGSSGAGRLPMIEDSCLDAANSKASE